MDKPWRFYPVLVQGVGIQSLAGVSRDFRSALLHKSRNYGVD